MRISFLRHRPLASVLAFAVMFGTTALAFTPAAEASGPTSLGVSGWQIYASTNTYVNPYTGATYHGYPSEFGAAPAIPAQNDPGWANCGASAPLRGGVSMCPSASTIGMAVGSILTQCWSRLNFTSFQALVSIPANTTISQFSVNMSGADDGARISLVNSAYPSGVTPTNGYIWQLTQQATGNLASYVVPGEVNRVVITQVDDCPVGNNLNSAQISLNGTIIPVAPSATPVATPAPNAAGWNNSDVTVNWNWTDSNSAIDTNNCTQTSTSSGEGTLTLNSTCQTVAGTKASDSYTVKVDKTAPTDNPVVTPAPNGAGWNNSNATVNWNWSDSGSGIDPNNCTQSSTSSGQGTITLTSTCTDLAGNSASDSRTVKVDTNAPTATPALQTVPNGAGWNNSDAAVNWNWSDAGSGIDPNNCTPSSTPTGQGTITLTTTCTDLAGNTATASFTENVDTTPPSSTPVAVPVANGNGWNNADVTVTWNWLDAGSGIIPASCTPSSTTSGEGTFTLAATCTDVAGNTGSAQYTVKVDKTAPTDNPVVTPAPNVAGWNNSNVSVAWNWSDSGSGIDPNNCTQSSTSSGQGTITLTSTCTDLAGNSASDSRTVKVDTTPPVANPVASPAANVAGWNNSNVTVNWNWSDSGSGIDTNNCTQSSTSSGQGTIALTSTCADVAGNTASASYTVKVDTTPPVANPIASPAANVAGWNNSNVSVAWNWGDAGSGIDPNNCTQSSTSSGQGTITLTSTCADVAGNTASASYTVMVDTTLPTVTYSGNAGTYNVAQSVAITCTPFDGLSGLASTTCSNLSAPAWTLALGTHTLTASATDVAGNVGTGTTSFTVTVDENSLCALVSQFTSNHGIANSLCVKLNGASAAQARGQLNVKANVLQAFENEVQAQSGKAFTEAQAALLIGLAAQL